MCSGGAARGICKVGSRPAKRKNSKSRAIVIEQQTRELLPTLGELLYVVVGHCRKVGGVAEDLLAPDEVWRGASAVGASSATREPGRNGVGGRGEDRRVVSSATLDREPCDRKVLSQGGWKQLGEPAFRNCDQSVAENQLCATR